jgi:hypothetical protein
VHRVAINEKSMALKVGDMMKKSDALAATAPRSLEFNALMYDVRPTIGN